MYLISTPFWLRALYPTLTWRIRGEGKVIYLTFDDGPHETATPFVLDELKKYNAKATFFCIGKNVVSHPEIYQRILAEGHATGNHTYHHINGWKVSDDLYLQEVRQTSELVHSHLFRPPYGRIRRSQIRKLRQSAAHALPMKLIMWDVLSADFDTRLTGEACLGYVLYHTKPGSIVLFHDSEKALPRLTYALPKMLQHFSKLGYRFDPIT